MTQRLELAARSDIGHRRRRNEDAVFAGSLAGADGWTLIAVADGVGGHARGDWASMRTIELLALELGPQVATSGPERGLRETVRWVNWSIRAEAKTLGATGAATTLVLALLKETEYWWLNIGDSRLYLHSGGELRQLSRDDSWVQEQVDAGVLDAESARHHPYRNVVTRTVGFEAAVEAGIAGPFTLGPGETLLACSDGLFGPVEDAALAAIVARPNVEDVAQRLVELANEAGGPDNITVALARNAAPAS